MQRLWIISELFPPDETSTAFILGEIANVMAQKYEVKVICGPEVYDKRKKVDAEHRFALKEGIEVLRAEGVDTDKNTFTGKAIRFAVITRQLYSLAMKHIKKEDKVLLVTNPAPLVVMVSRMKEKLGFELHILVHDVFPENTVPAGLKLPKIGYNILKKVFDKAYGRADQLICLGRDMKAVLEKKVKAAAVHPKVCIIENWSDLDIVSPLASASSHERFVLEYAGNIGRVQGLQSLVANLKEAQNEQLEFHLWGTGAAENGLKKYVELEGMRHVVFHGAYLRAKQSVVLNSCDMALVTLSEGMFGLGVPSKTYNIMAAGKPILFIGEPQSEIGLLVKEKGIGYVFEPSDRQGIVDFLRSLSPKRLSEMKEMGLRARKVAEDEYAKEIILNKFVRAI